MIGWLAPAALAGLALVALPVIVHLLRTQRAQRIPFPTLRFIAASRTSAVRLQPPSDWRLLLVRAAIVAAGVLATAQPVLVTHGRVDTWNRRVARAVVVDTSRAMQLRDGAAPSAADLAGPLIEAELAGGAPTTRIDTPAVGDGLTRASAWLDAAPPARREIVVLSTFPAGSLGDAAIAQVPPGVGLRLVQVGTAPDSRIVEAIRPFTAPGEPLAVQDAVLTGPKTALTRRSAAGEQAGLRVRGFEPGAPAVQRLWRTVAAAGAPAPSADQPLALLFGDAAAADAISPLGPESPRWMIRTLARLREDDELRRAAAGAAPSQLRASDRWTTVAVDATGGSLARIAATPTELVMQVGAPIESLFGAAAARAVLAARAGDPGRPDEDVLRLPAATLAAWSRPAAPIDGAAWRSIESSDARWLWALALALLALEQWLRRASLPAAVEVRDAA